MPGVNLFSGNELDPADCPDAALVFGGDGTMHRYLAGLSIRQIPTLIVPIGSANDFAQSIGVNDIAGALAAWRRFCTSGDNLRSIDLGVIESIDSANPSAAATDTTKPEPWQDETLESLHFVPDGPRRDQPKMAARIMHSQLRHATEAQQELSCSTFFSCIAGTGLDAKVNRLALNQPRWLRSHGGYVVGLLQVLGSFRPPRIKVCEETSAGWQTRIDEPGFLIAVGNGPQYGHGMRLTHEAKMDDGLFDLCFVKNLSKLRLLWLFHVVYRGRHIQMPEVEYLRSAKVRIETDPVSEVFADGEYICPTPVEISVRPKALRIIVP